MSVSDAPMCYEAKNRVVETVTESGNAVHFHVETIVYPHTSAPCDAVKLDSWQDLDHTDAGTATADTMIGVRCYCTVYCLCSFGGGGHVWYDCVR